MKFNIEIDASLAVKIAQYLEMSGMQQYANDMWLELERVHGTRARAARRASRHAL